MTAKLIKKGKPPPPLKHRCRSGLPYPGDPFDGSVYECSCGKYWTNLRAYGEWHECTREGKQYKWVQIPFKDHTVRKGIFWLCTTCGERKLFRMLMDRHERRVT